MADEILRAHAERQIESKINLIECCDAKPIGKFISCRDYWVECPVCKRKTKKCKKYYQAMQEWNRIVSKGGIRNESTRQVCY